ncbi:MAG: DNA polymerase III subunit beta [Bacilli bacterium]
MQFQIDKKMLQTNLNYVSKAVSSKTPIPALNGIKFELNQEGLILIGSGLELTIKAFIPKVVNEKEIINIQTTGTMIVNETYITEIVKKVEDDFISFELIEGNQVRIKTKQAKFNLNCISAEEYPRIDIIKSDENITFTKADFKKIISQTVFAVSRQESRPILTGVCFDFVGNVVNIAATDSYRLSNKLYTNNGELNANIIIPGKSLMDLNNICNGFGDITMHVFSNKVMFEFDNVVFQSKLLEGTYPNVSKLIPTDFETEIIVDSKSLVNTIDRASILSRDKTKNVVKLQLDNNNAIISSNSPEVGKIEESIFIESIKLGSFDISFSARFVREAILSHDCEKVLLKFNGDMKPIIIVNPEDNTNIQLVLPVRTY